MASTTHSATCMFCHQLLRITTDATESDAESDQFERGEAATVVDDVELYCSLTGSGSGGHHAHWTCLIDHAKQARTRGVPPTCIVCGQNTLDLSGRFIVDVRNEGGETRGFDFGDIIEELFLDSNPSQVHNRAFHDLIAEGDYMGVIELIAEHDVDINCTYGRDGLTALQKAMFRGDANGVEFLKGLGARE